jgi:hypothetical protein
MMIPEVGNMQTIRPWLIAVIFGLLVFATGAFAQTLDTIDALQCAGGPVFIGDNQYKVWEKCGEPALREEYGRIWIYNFGPTDFIYYLTFANDVLEQIQIDGYGH